MRLFGLPQTYRPPTSRTLWRYCSLRWLKSFIWSLRTGPTAALAVHAVAARAVGLVEVVAALDGGDLLQLVLRRPAAGRVDDRDAASS